MKPTAAKATRANTRMSASEAGITVLGESKISSSTPTKSVKISNTPKKGLVDPAFPTVKSPNSNNGTKLAENHRNRNKMPVEVVGNLTVRIGLETTPTVNQNGDHKPLQVPETAATSSTHNKPCLPKVNGNEGVNTATDAHETGKSENGNEQKAKITRIVRKVTRPELEEMMVEKILECFTANSELAVLRRKINELNAFAASLVEKERALRAEVATLAAVVKEVITSQRSNLKTSTVFVTDETPQKRPRLSVPGPSSVQAEHRLLAPDRFPAPIPQIHIVEETLPGSITLPVAVAALNTHTNKRVSELVLIEEGTLVDRVSEAKQVDVAASAITPEAPVSAVDVVLVKNGASVQPVSNERPAIESSFKKPALQTTPMVERAISRIRSTQALSPINQAGNKRPTHPSGPGIEPPPISFLVPGNQIQNPGLPRLTRNGAKALAAAPNIQRRTSPRFQAVAKCISIPKAQVPPKLNDTNNKSQIMATTTVLTAAKKSILEKPSATVTLNERDLIPIPVIKLKKDAAGIRVQWDLEASRNQVEIYKYEIFVLMEPLSKDTVLMKPQRTNHWRIIGEPEAMPLPMECLLTRFARNSQIKYHFKVRGVNMNKTCGRFSESASIVLKK